MENAKVSKADMNRTGRGTKLNKGNSKYDSKENNKYDGDGDGYDHEEGSIWDEYNGGEDNSSASRHVLPHFALYNDVAIFDTFSHQWLQVIVNANGEA